MKKANIHHGQDKPRRVGTSRPKPRLSCRTCRDKKLKCDRQLPCGNCTRSSAGTDCVYAQTDLPSASINKQTRQQKQSHGEDRLVLLERRLEQLAARLEGHQDPSRSVDHASTASASETPVSLQDDLENTTKHFTSTDHWEGVLSSIHDIQQDIHAARKALKSTQTSKQGPELLFWQHQDISEDELHNIPIHQSAIPALVELILEDTHSQWLLQITHKPSIREAVFRHITTPYSTDLASLALFYGLLSLGSYLVYQNSIHIEHVSDPEKTSRICMRRATQCLRNSLYVKPSSNTITALIIYGACEHNWSDQNAFEASVVISMINRLALRMGYHRDPSNFATISPFDSEMRRRVWAFLQQLDYLFARKCGLPRMIDDSKSDTMPPRNLSDTELYPLMQHLPESSPMDEHSTIAVLIIRTSVLNLCTRIMDLDQGLKQTTYATVLELDRELADFMKGVPKWLRVGSDEAAFGLGSESGASPLDLELLIQSAWMSLHRKYLISGRTNPEHEFSRVSCLNAARRVLSCQEILFSNFSNLHRIWRVLSLMMHDLLLAALLICLDADHGLRQLNQEHHTSEALSSKSSELIEALEPVRKAQLLWKQFGEFRSSGREAALILGKLLERFDSSLLKFTSVSGKLDMVADTNIDQFNPNWSSSLMVAEPQATELLQAPGLTSENAVHVNDLDIQKMLEDAQLGFDWVPTMPPTSEDAFFFESDTGATDNYWNQVHYFS